MPHWRSAAVAHCDEKTRTGANRYGSREKNYLNQSMEDQQIDLLRVGHLALKVADSLWIERRRRNRFALALEEMLRSTGLPVARCQEVMETLARLASQQDYENTLSAIRQAAEEARRGK